MMLSVRHRSGISYMTSLSRKTKLYKITQANYYPYYPATNSKKPNKLLIGVVLTSFVAGSYLYFKRKPKKDEEAVIVPEEEVVPTRYVDPQLDESLSLLEEYGSIPYLLIGAGAASFSAFRAIRANDPTSKILIVGAEPFYPYMRPPLSKEIWFSNNPDVAKDLRFKLWNGRERSLFFERDEFYCSVKDMLSNNNGGLSVLRGVQVVHIDPVAKAVFLDNGKIISYKKCLLATGGKPKTLPVVENANEDVKKNITLFRTIRDFQMLSNIITKVKSVTIIGGGYLGSELACALGKRSKQAGLGLEVTQVFPESGNMGQVFPEYLSNWSTEKIRDEGVNIIPSTTIKNILKVDGKIHLHLSDGRNIVTDHVIVAVGLEPNTELAQDAGLEIDEHHGGFVVNSELEARKDLWVAGDAACFYDLRLGRRRVEHHDHAMISGRLAGENMTGSGNPYSHQSMFWSDLGSEIGYEAVGIIDSSLPTVGVFVKGTEGSSTAIIETTGEPQVECQKKPKSTDPSSLRFDKNLGKGVVFYLRNNIIVGVLLWNVFTKMSIARKVINEIKPNCDIVEVAKLFNINEKLKDD